MRNAKAEANRCSIVSLAVNTLLSIGKMAAGFVANSAAMVSDGIHSASDVISTVIVIVGIQLSKEDVDEDYEYGRERFECIVALVLAMLLFITGLIIGWTGLEKILFGKIDDIAVPGMLALIAAIVSIVVKEWMYQYTMRVARKTGLESLKADAWHHRSDAFSSIGTLFGIGAARLGFPIMDPIASIIVCVFIVQAAYNIFTDASKKLVDHSCPRVVEKQIRDIIESTNGVYRIDLLKTRMFGSRIYVEVEVAADHTLSFDKAHEIAEQVHHNVEDVFPAVKHCAVHINPIVLEEDNSTDAVS